MNFSCIVRTLFPDLATTIKVQEHCCPDQYVGYISQIVKEKRIDPLCRKRASCRPSHRAVLLILESPHVKEFEEHEGNPAPARGQTGDNIANYICKVLGLETKTELPLILINAVQFQCSLGVPIKSSGGNKSYRDSVFRAAWKDGGREDFQKRLRDIYREGDLVVCSCTKGGGSPREHLRQLVYEAIVDELKSVDVQCVKHPVGWHWKGRSWTPLGQAS